MTINSYMDNQLLRAVAKFLGTSLDDLDEDVKHFSTNSEALVGDVVYDPDLRELYVTYTGGNSYTYYDISPQKFAAFKRSTSRGRFINFKIKQQGYIYSRGVDI